MSNLSDEMRIMKSRSTLSGVEDILKELRNKSYILTNKYFYTLYYLQMHLIIYQVSICITDNFII